MQDKIYHYKPGKIFRRKWSFSGSYLPKYEGNLKKWLNMLADALKRLAGKTIAALPATVGTVFGVV